MLLVSFSDVIARFHPVVVHLPIGILVMAVLFQWLSTRNSYAFLLPAIPVALFWGMIGAVVACISGYLLSLSGDYDEVIAGRHQWMGISVAGFSLLLYLLHKLSLRDDIARWLSLLLLALIIVTGHLGGTLTHGEGYLSAGFSEGKSIQPIANVPEAEIYGHVVKPILQAKCYTCHGLSKQKGKLRLDAPEWILKGGKGGEVIVPGKPGESELIKRILLPMGDDDHMPPQAKPQLTENEILLIQWWVTTGASFEKKIKEFEKDEKVSPALAALSGAKMEEEIIDLVGKEVERADDRIVNKLRHAGVVVLPVSKESNYLLANFISLGSIPDSVLQLLGGIKKQLVFLKFDSKSVDNASLNIIAECTELRKLQLRNAGITDEGLIKLKRLNKLESLNLVGTDITVAGLKQLGLSRLKNLYLYRTGINAADWPILRQAMPGVAIDTGNYTVPTFSTDTTVIKF